MNQLDVETVQDLNRLFDYVFIINDGKIIKMMTKEEEENRMRYIDMIF